MKLIFRPVKKIPDPHRPTLGLAGGCFFILLLLLAACKNAAPADNGDKNKTSTSIVHNAHTANGLDTVAAAMKPTLDFKDTTHDFGAIHQDEVVSYEFAFTNNGKSPLLITSAYGSCGCTVPDYPREEIAPGKGGVLKVTFNSAGKFGHQEKSVYIHTNTLRGVHMLYIKVDVETNKK